MRLFDGLDPAIVTDNNDPIKYGRIQVRSLVEGSGYDSTHLPWIKPLFKSTGGSSTYGKSDIPEIDSKVYITYEKYKQRKNGYYVFDANDNNLNPYQKFDTDIKSHITGFLSSYPDVKFTLYKNGICIGVSSNATNKEIFMYHPSGTFIFIDETGKFYVNSIDDLSIKSNTKKIRLENNNGFIELAATGQVNINNNLTVDI